MITADKESMEMAVSKPLDESFQAIATEGPVDESTPHKKTVTSCSLFFDASGYLDATLDGKVNEDKPLPKLGVDETDTAASGAVADVRMDIEDDLYGGSRYNHSQCLFSYNLFSSLITSSLL